MNKTIKNTSFVYSLRFKNGKCEDTQFRQLSNYNNVLYKEERIPLKNLEKLTVFKVDDTHRYPFFTCDIPEGNYKDADFPLNLTYDPESSIPSVTIRLPKSAKKKWSLKRKEEEEEKSEIVVRDVTPPSRINASDSHDMEILLASKERTLKRYKEELVERDTLIDSQKKKLVEFTHSKRNLENEIIEIRNNLTKSEQDVEKKEKELATLKSSITDTSKELEEVQRQHTATTTELEALQRQHKVTTSEKTILESRIKELTKGQEEAARTIDTLTKERNDYQNISMEQGDRLQNLEQLILTKKLYYPSSLHAFLRMLQQLSNLLNMLAVKEVVMNGVVGLQVDEVLGSHSKLHSAQLLLGDFDTKKMEEYFGRKIDSSFLDVSNQEVLEKLLIPLDLYSDTPSCTLTDRLIRICVYGLDPVYGSVYRNEEKRAFKRIFDILTSFFKLHLDIDIKHPQLLKDSFNPKNHEALSERSYIQQNIPDTAKAVVGKLPNGTIFDFLICEYRFGTTWDGTPYEKLVRQAKVYILNI